MRKIFFFFLVLALSTSSFCQQPILSVQRFEYILEPFVSIPYSNKKKRVNIASDDAARQSIEKSFSRSLKQCWDIVIPEMALIIKPLSFFSYEPKFNTKLKDRKAGTWYLFLQIFDIGNRYFNNNDNDSLSTILELKCRLVSGSNDSVILDRTLSVNIYKEKAPANQVELNRLPAYPTYFINAFDTIASWLFQTETENLRSLTLKPACVFSASATTIKPVTQLFFDTDAENIHHLTSPSFALRLSRPVYEKIKTKHNIGENIAGGILTSLTGVGTNKSKIYQYTADFPFEENDKTYHCFVNYTEKKTEGREREKTVNPDGSKSYSITTEDSYSLSERLTDTSFLNAITLDKDTLATFRFGYLRHAKEQQTYTRFWDGSDSTTILDLPHEWNNSTWNDNVILTGESSSIPFSMKTTMGILTKEFYIDEKLVIIMYWKGALKTAMLYQPLSVAQLKLFTILSSIPYSYFNYSAY